MADIKALDLGTGGNLIMKDGSALHTETMETIGGTASKAYSVGEYFIGTDGLMYQTTIAITSGDTLVLNTNCVKSDLTNILNTNNVIRPTIVIPDNSDIDDYTTPGVYTVATLESAATISNLPEDVTGKLIVAFNTSIGSSITQIYFEAFTNNIHTRKWDRYEARWTDWARLAKKQELDARILVGAHNLAEPYEQVAIFGNDDDGFSFSYNATSLGYVAKVSPGVTYVIKKSSSYGNRFRIIGFSTKPAINTTIPGVQILNNSSMNEYKFTNSPGYSYLWITANYNSAVDFDAVEGQVFIADDDYSEYLPYTKTNRELTEWVNDYVEQDHNVPRKIPKDITAYYTDGSLWDRLNGRQGYSLFEDIFVGDYIEMSRPITAPNQDSQYAQTGCEFVTIIGIDSCWANGDGQDNVPKIDYHHLVMTAGKGFTGTQHFGRKRMNSTATTVGGYVASEMHTATLGAVVSSGSTASGATINQQLYAEFGEHLKTTREKLTNQINNDRYNRYGTLGTSSGNVFVTCQAVLMSEVEVYGSIAFSSSGFDAGVGRQFPLFAFNRRAQNTSICSYWLRDIASSQHFCVSVNSGDRSLYNADTTFLWVRPRFILA